MFGSMGTEYSTAYFRHDVRSDYLPAELPGTLSRHVLSSLGSNSSLDGVQRCAQSGLHVTLDNNN